MASELLERAVRGHSALIEQRYQHASELLMLRLRNVASALAQISFAAFICAGAFWSSKAVLAIAMVTGAAYLLFDIVAKDGRIGTLLLVFIAGVVVSYPLSLLNNGFSSGFMHGGMVLGSAGVALYFGNSRNSRLAAASLWSLLALYLGSVLLIGRATDAVFLGSQNRVSTLFLALAVLLFAMRRHASDSLLAGVVLFACVVAGGSSGIIGAILLFVVVVLREAAAPGQYRHLRRIGLAVAVTAVAVAVASVLSQEAMMKLAIDRLVGGDVRYQIIRAYARENFHGVNLLAGTRPVYAFDVIDEGSASIIGNLHNSYLSVHSKAGIFSIVIVGAIFFRLGTLVSKNKVFAGMLLVLLLRAFSDTVFILDGTYNFSLLFFLLPLSSLHHSTTDQVSAPPSAATESRALRNEARIS